MKIGISSSCLYPEKIEDSLKKVGELGVKTAEIFVNSPSEIVSPIIDELKSIREYYGIEIRSVHPFTSAFETFMFFTNYERRKKDSLDFYRGYFKAAEQLGAEMVVFHGGLSSSGYDPEYYAECYGRLHSAAKDYGAFVAHENVREHLCCDPEYMKKLSDYTGDDFRMVLDIKQCRRSGFSEFDFIRLLGDKIAQVHISDFDEKHDCIAPGCGKYDFGKLFSALENAGYNNSALIELYRSNFGKVEELKTSMDYLNTI